MKTYFHNGTIYTMEGKRIASSMLVEDGRIVKMDVEQAEAEGAAVVDLQGKAVIPGLHDSHMHFLCYAIDKEKIDFFHATSLADMEKLTREYLQKYDVPKGEWIQGGGWNENNFAASVLPTRQDLDRMSPDNPAIFTRACCSVAVANTAALQAAGIFENPPLMDDGVIVVDETGVPTGMLNERARFLLYDIIPNRDKDYIKELILNYQDDLLKVGLTTVQTDDFKLWDATFEDIMAAYEELDKEGKLKVRFIQQVRLVDHDSLDRFLKRGQKTGDGTGHFKIGAFKLLPDGSLGGKTAALREDYEGDPDNKGILTYSREALYKLMEKAHKAGFQQAMHAIGDRAMDVVLDCYEELKEKYPQDDPRFRIIHCQITTEDIIKRFKNLDVIGDIQPLFIRADMDVAEALIGGRTKEAYNWKTFLDEGVVLAGSSDAPVESFDPLLGVYSAVSRKKADGSPCGGWMPEQKLTVEQAVELYTGGSAYSAFEEKEKGRLKEGYLADFIVLSNDVFRVDEAELLDVRVEQAYVGGALMYQGR